MVKKKTKKKSVKRTIKKTRSARREKRTSLTVVALILNVLILPGLGSLIGGKTKEGILQMVLIILGLLLPIVVGIPIIFIAWVWGIITGVTLVQGE